MKLVAGSIDVWVRCKAIYDRHEAGEPMALIAADFGITTKNGWALAHRWQTVLEVWQSGDYNPRAQARYDKLIAAGLLGNGKRSPEYGYA